MPSALDAEGYVKSGGVHSSSTLDRRRGEVNLLIFVPQGVGVFN